MDLKIADSLRYGDIWLADMGIKHESELGKLRPVLIIQTAFSLVFEESSVVVIPFTTQIEPEFSVVRIRFVEVINGLDKASDLLVNQIRAIHISRFKEHIGIATENQMNAVRTSLQILLGL